MEQAITGNENILEVGLSNSGKLDEANEDRRKIADEAKKNRRAVAEEQTARMLNNLKELFDVFEEREKEREKREREREEREKSRSEETNNRLEKVYDELRKANTPSPCHHQTTPAPPLQQQVPQFGWPQPQIHMPAPWYPPAGQNTQPTWLVAPQGQLVAPWIPPLLPPVRQQEPQQLLTGAEILHIMNIPEIEKSDLRYILESRYTIPSKSRLCAEAAISVKEFRNWITKQESAELLIDGDFNSDGAELSALSLLSATLIQALETRERYIRLVFFCGRHTEEDDAHAGGRAMARSFIAQMLRQHAFDLSSLEQDINIKRIRKGNVKELCRLLVWLVRRLPKDMKVICIIDEVGKYERDDYEDNMLKVLRSMLGLARESGTGCIIKVLATSAEATDEVRDAFKDDDNCLLDMDAIDEGDELGMFELESKLVGDSDDSDSDSDLIT